MAYNGSLCDLISIDDVIANAKMKLSMSNSDNDLWFEVEIYNRLRSFNSPSTLRPVIKRVEVCDNKFRIPKGMYELKGIRLDWSCDEDTSVNGLTTQPPVIPLIVYGRGFPGYYGPAYIESLVTMANGYGHLNCGWNDDITISSCIIYYTGLNVDDVTGQFLIYSSYEECLASWLCYAFLRTNPDYYDNPYVTKDLRTEYYSHYKAQKDFIKGSEKKVEFDQERLELGAVLNQIIINNYDIYPYWG